MSDQAHSCPCTLSDHVRKPCIHEVHRSLVMYREPRAREALARPVARADAITTTGTICSIAHSRVCVVTAIHIDTQTRAAVTSTGGRGKCRRPRPDTRATRTLTGCCGSSSSPRTDTWRSLFHGLFQQFQTSDC